MYNIFATYKKLGVTSAYPGKDNCYKVEIIPDGGTSGHIFDYFPEKEFKLIEEMQKLIDVVPEEQLRTVMEKIEEYGNERYYAAEDQAAMDNAGADL